MTNKTDTGTRQYPACLERPDLGGRVRVRTQKTEAEYRKRYHTLPHRAARFYSAAGSPMEAPVAEVARVARWLVSIASTLRPSAYRQYRASVNQHLRDLWDMRSITLTQVESIAASMLLTREAGEPSPYAPKNTPLRTSAGRAKSIRLAKATAIAKAAGARDTLTGQNLADVFSFGPSCGLRNLEWGGTVLTGNVLTIPCGKFSIENARGVAPFRTQVLNLEAAALERLAAFLRRLQSEIRDADGRVDLVMRRQSRLLRTIRKDAGAPRVTLRTVRHQCTANLRAAGYSREERAAVLGHAAADTSDDHYGKANRGWRDRQRWLEVPTQLTQLVRPGAKTASKIARGLPLTRAEWHANQLPKPGI